MPGLRWTEMSLIAVQLPVGAPDRDRRQLERLELARERAVEVVAEPVRVERGEEADLAEVDREHRHAGARVLAQRGEDRAVAAEHDAEVDVVCAAPRRSRRPSPGSSPCLRGLVGVEAQRRRRRAARRRSARAAASAVLAARGGG